MRLSRLSETTDIVEFIIVANIGKQEVKDALIAAGKWADAVRLRDDLKMGGMKPIDAMKEACRRLAPELLGLFRPPGRPRLDGAVPGTVGHRSIVPRKRKPAKARASLADVKREARDARMSAASASSAKVAQTVCATSPSPDIRHGVEQPRPRGVDLSVFAGKSCSISAAFMWAYPMVSVDGVRPEDAPSAIAWQMLVDMKASPSIRADLIKSGLIAAMRKAGEEEDMGRRFDGEGEYDICAAIAGATDEGSGKGGGA